ncbi:TIR domain-containing protein [Sphingomonas jeddahensis]|uniref:Putative nucleotide-binding protein containing TIR-like domain protein n=1 Tax=Sphingomonas jeddahensis TaxID=1915074 RepID=A0A1V2ESM0_9SPHN|nr:nucleotide-binding protein [Sphingomonas jeddahensis]ONF95174.1 putative nucleotide-binding protein containing TIR-like domain protein [Sphingomonas jeddahensis]
MTSRDLFARINGVVLDLQSSNYSTYTHPIKKLNKLLWHEDLVEYNEKLIRGLDLDKFLSENPRTRGSMIGSGRIDWPDSQDETLGLQLLLIKRFAENPDFMLNFGYYYYHSGNKHDGNLRSLIAQLIIPFAREYRDFVDSGATTVTKLAPALSKRVFVVHGHDEGARETVARYLEKIGLEAIILHEQANQGRTIIEKIEAHSDVSFAVVLLTPDDYGGKLGEPSSPRARQNVILELGYFVGRLGRGHVCALMRGQIEVPTDWSGVVYQTMDPGGGWKAALAKELAVLGHDIDWNKVMQ